MKVGSILLIGAGALALIYFSNLGIAGNVLQYYIQSVNFQGITSGTITLMVQNPSNATIILNSMAGTVCANGSIIGNISNFSGGVQIAPNSQAPVTIQCNLNLPSLLSNLFTILTSPTGANSVAFVIAGNANINGGLIVPFNITQTVTV